MTIGEVCRKAGLSDATFYGRRKKYAGLMPSEMRPLRQLEGGKTQSKRLVVDLSPGKAMLQDRSAVLRLCGDGLSRIGPGSEFVSQDLDLWGDVRISSGSSLCLIHNKWHDKPVEINRLVFDLHCKKFEDSVERNIG